MKRKRTQKKPKKKVKFHRPIEKIGKKWRFKTATKTIQPTKKQIGKSNIKRDVLYKALPPGKRISSSGKIYYEKRKNRSDASNNE